MQKFLCLVFIVAPAISTAQTQWTKEPTAVMGMMLGVPLLESGITECEKEMSFGRLSYKFPPKGPMCYETDGTEDLALRNIPILANARATLVNGKVASVTIDAAKFRFDEFMAMLIERYGPPTNTEKESVQVRAGGKFEAQLISWRGKNVSIKATEMCGKITESCFRFYHEGSMRELSEQRGAAARREANKL